MRTLALVLVAGTVLSGCSLLRPLPRGDASGRPNIVFVVADDLDRETLMHLPRLRAMLADEGTTFRNAFVNVTLSGPARATILRGQYAHHSSILTNQPPDGGFERFHQLGLEASTIATWLQAAGYRTGLVGKYLNGYPTGVQRSYVPPGWDEWFGPSDGSPYGEFDYELNENGKLVRYGSGSDEYLTDVLAKKAVGFIRDSAADPARRPFFLYLATYAPHAPATPAPRHAAAFADARAPRTPAFDEADVSDKPAWIRAMPALTEPQQRMIDDLYRRRLQTMLAVEDLVQSLLDTLRDMHELDRTYVFFSSDNGFHLGQHRLPAGKATAYEEDVTVPLIVRGPQVPERAVREHLVSNIDLAPTWADIAGVTPASFVDGRSLLPLLRAQPPPLDQWRRAVLIERNAVTTRKRAQPTRSPAPSGSIEPSDPGGPPPIIVPRYSAIRTAQYTYVEYASGERELYDLESDPYQLDNVAEFADRALVNGLAAQLAALRACREPSCRRADGR